MQLSSPKLKHTMLSRRTLRGNRSSQDALFASPFYGLIRSAERRGRKGGASENPGGGGEEEIKFFAVNRPLFGKLDLSLSPPPSSLLPLALGSGGPTAMRGTRRKKDAAAAAPTEIGTVQNFPHLTQGRNNVNT